jgi:hypothetical protein
VEALIAASIAQASVPLPSAGEGKLIMMSAGKKQRLAPEGEEEVMVLRAPLDFGAPLAV